MHHHALRAPAIVGVAIERQDFAAIAARRVDGFFECGEQLCDNAAAGFAGGHGDLDPQAGLNAVLAMEGEHDGVAHVPGAAQPEAVLETPRRANLADIDVLILRRRDRRRVLAALGERGEGERLVAVPLENTHEANGRSRHQAIDGNLHIGTHVTGKLPGAG